MRGHDQSPARNDPDYIVRPPKEEMERPQPNEFCGLCGSIGRAYLPAAAAAADETTDDPEKHTAATFKEELQTCCAAIAMHLKIPEVDPWFQGIVSAIDRTSAVWTLSKGNGEYLAIVEGNPMFPSPRAIRRSKTFSLALAWAFCDWLEQREQD